MGGGASEMGCPPEPVLHSQVAHPVTLPGRPNPRLSVRVAACRSDIRDRRDGDAAEKGGRLRSVRFSCAYLHRQRHGFVTPLPASCCRRSNAAPIFARDVPPDQDQMLPTAQASSISSASVWGVLRRLARGRGQPLLMRQLTPTAAEQNMPQMRWRMVVRPRGTMVWVSVGSTVSGASGCVPGAGLGGLGKRCVVAGPSVPQRMAAENEP